MSDIKERIAVEIQRHHESAAKHLACLKTHADFASRCALLDGLMIKEESKAIIAGTLLLNLDQLVVFQGKEERTKVITPWNRESGDKYGWRISYEGQQWDDDITLYLNGVEMWRTAHCKGVAVCATPVGKNKDAISLFVS